MPLASATASSSVSKGCTVSTGPNTSSAIDPRVGRQVGDDGGLVVEAAVEVERLAAADDPAALLAGELDVLLDLAQLPLAGHRADDRRLVARVADRHGRHRLLEDADDGVVQRAGDEQPRAGHAELAGVEDERLDHRADGHVEVGVVEDDVGGVAAELHGDRLEVLAGHAGGVPADRGGPGERDLVDAGVAQQRLADDLAAAGDHVEHAVGDAGVVTAAGP